MGAIPVRGIVLSGEQGGTGARSSSRGLRPLFVGASKFLILIMNFENAQFVVPPRYRFR